MKLKLTPEDEFRSTIQTLATEAALRHFQRENPRATAEAGGQFAARNWRQFVQVACDIMAAWQAIDEASAASKNN